MRSLIVKLLIGIAMIVTFFGINIATMANASAGNYLCTENGNNYCIADQTLNIGDNLGQNTQANSRLITETPIDSNCTPATGAQTCLRVYLTFYNGYHFSMPDSCSQYPIVSSASDTTGVVWRESLFTNNDPIISEFDNQLCGPGGSLARLGADNVQFHNFDVDYNIESGIYYRMQWN